MILTQKLKLKEDDDNGCEEKHLGAIRQLEYNVKQGE